MNVRIKKKLSNAAKKAIYDEARRQCVEITSGYEIELDTTVLYILHTEFGFGKKRLERFYSTMFKRREEMQEWFQAEKEDGIIETAMRFELRQAGIDVEQMYKNQKDSRRLRAVLD